jgi:hypothetical protein
MAEREGSKHAYRCVATTLEGFVQQLAVAYVARRYFFYVTGRVPARMAATEHDRRLLAKYDVALSKWSRYRRRRRASEQGQRAASVQYLRYGQFWVLLATAGEHRFFHEHQGSISDKGRVPRRQFHDVRERPISFGGYSIGWRKRVTIRIAPRVYRELRKHFLDMALATYATGRLEREFQAFPYESYAGVTRQMLAIFRAVNRRRRTAGLPGVPRERLPFGRRAIRPFDEPRPRASVVCLESIQWCIEQQKEKPMISVVQRAKTSEGNGAVVDLFGKQAPSESAALRAAGQRERLAKLSSDLAEMLDRLDVELKVDRERAVAMLAECTGLLEIAVEDLGRIREVDERFGGDKRRLPRVAKLAEKLEKGLAYLLGIFSVVSSGENLSPFNWKLVERDVQMVLGVARAIDDELTPPTFKQAA